MMVLRTSRAPRMHAGHVGERSVRNRASPFFALNAARTGDSVDAVVRSVSCARAALGCVAELAFGSTAGWSAVGFFDSHPRSEATTASARAWERIPAKMHLDLAPGATAFYGERPKMLTLLGILGGRRRRSNRLAPGVHSSSMVHPCRSRSPSVRSRC